MWARALHSQKPRPPGIAQGFPWTESSAESFPPALLKFSTLGLGKKRNRLENFGNERTAPTSNPALGSETRVWFLCDCALPRFASTRGTSPSSSITSGSSVQKTLTQARFTQMAKYIWAGRSPLSALNPLGMSRDGGLTTDALAKRGPVRKGWRELTPRSP